MIGPGCPSVGLHRKCSRHGSERKSPESPLRERGGRRGRRRLARCGAYISVLPISASSPTQGPARSGIRDRERVLRASAAQHRTSCAPPSSTQRRRASSVASRRAAAVCRRRCRQRRCRLLHRRRSMTDQLHRCIHVDQRDLDRSAIGEAGSVIAIRYPDPNRTTSCRRRSDAVDADLARRVTTP